MSIYLFSPKVTKVEFRVILVILVHNFRNFRWAKPKSESGVVLARGFPGHPHQHFALDRSFAQRSGWQCSPYNQKANKHQRGGSTQWGRQPSSGGQVPLRKNRHF
jgi:hypothetical protein